jgi:hypothetical protein
MKHQRKFGRRRMGKLRGSDLRRGHCPTAWHCLQRAADK